MRAQPHNTRSTAKPGIAIPPPRILCAAVSFPSAYTRHASRADDRQDERYPATTVRFRPTAKGDRSARTARSNSRVRSADQHQGGWPRVVTRSQPSWARVARKCYPRWSAWRLARGRQSRGLDGFGGGTAETGRPAIGAAAERWVLVEIDALAATLGYPSGSAPGRGDRGGRRDGRSRLVVKSRRPPTEARWAGGGSGPASWSVAGPWPCQ